jgi:uncharacterized protein
MANEVSWFEVMGPEPEQTAKFYGELFGWHTETLPEFDYTLIDTHAGTGINGGIGKTEDGRATLAVYVESNDLQGALDKAVSLGGKVATPVTEATMVTFAFYTDPAGNAVGLVAPSEQSGGVSEGDGVPVDWFEILGPDPRALWSFYRELFGWNIEEGGTDEFLYGQTYGEKIGGGIGSSPDGAPHVNVYAKVDDLQTYLDRAESLGGKTIMPPTDMDNVSFAMLADPQGTTFGLYKMTQA